LRIIPSGVEGRGSKATEVAGKESESERIRREMGAIGKRGMLVEVDSVWRVFAEENGNAYGQNTGTQ
jgi:RNA-splicing ligase RtcB